MRIDFDSYHVTYNAKRPHQGRGKAHSLEAFTDRRSNGEYDETITQNRLTWLGQERHLPDEYTICTATAQCDGTINFRRCCKGRQQIAQFLLLYYSNEATL